MTLSRFGGKSGARVPEEQVERWLRRGCAEQVEEEEEVRVAGLLVRSPRRVPARLNP